MDQKQSEIIIDRAIRYIADKLPCDTRRDSIIEELEQVKLFAIPDVVQQSEQFKTIVFKMANMLALAGKGKEAVQMHRIHNSL